MFQEETPGLLCSLRGDTSGRPEGYFRTLWMKEPRWPIALAAAGAATGTWANPYLTWLLTAFPKQRKARKRQPKQAKQHAVAQLQPN